MTDEEETGIPQPPVRPLEAGERYVRVAGLKFILPCKFAPGDVLDDQTAAFMNAAWHTAIINRFTPIRLNLLEDSRTTYEDFDRELQAFYESFEWTDRVKRTGGDEKPKKSEEEKALESFARPLFNKAMRGHGLPRERYEELLQEFITDNKVMLKEQFDRQQKSVNSLTSALIGLGTKAEGTSDND